MAVYVSYYKTLIYSWQRIAKDLKENCMKDFLYSLARKQLILSNIKEDESFMHKKGLYLMAEGWIESVGSCGD
jgi:hypothetical protein